MEQGKSRFGLAIGLVVVALAGTVCLVRLVPVRAAGTEPAVAHAAQSGSQIGGLGIGQVTAPSAPAAPTAPQAAPLAAPVPDAAAEMEARQESAEAHDFANDAKEIQLEESAGHGYVFVEGGRDSELALRGVPKEKAEKLRREHKGSYVYFERDGKGYVIDDPTVVAQGKALFQPNPDFKLDQAKLQAEMAKLQEQMNKLANDEVRKQMESPEFKAKMDKMSHELGELEGQKAKELAERAAKMTAKLDAEALKLDLGKIDVEIGDLDGKIGDIQGEIGDLNGEIGEKLGKLGDKQGEIGEKMGKIGEKLGRLGEMDGRKAEEANRKMNRLLDEAVKSGKAKPIQ